MSSKRLDLTKAKENLKEFRTKKTYSIYQVQMVGELLNFKEKNKACKVFLDHNLKVGFHSSFL